MDPSSRSRNTWFLFVITRLSILFSFSLPPCSTWVNWTLTRGSSSFSSSCPSVVSRPARDVSRKRGEDDARYVEVRGSGGLGKSARKCVDWRRHRMKCADFWYADFDYDTLSAEFLYFSNRDGEFDRGNISKYRVYRYIVGYCKFNNHINNIDIRFDRTLYTLRIIWMITLQSENKSYTAERFKVNDSKNSGKKIGETSIIVDTFSLVIFGL